MESALIGLSRRASVKLDDVAVESITGKATMPFDPGFGSADVYINASHSIGDVELSRRTQRTVVSATSTRARPSLGFSETFRGERGTLFDVCVARPTSDAAEVVVGGRLQTQLFYLENMTSVATHANHYLKQVLTDLSGGRTDWPRTVARTTDADLAPSALDLARYPGRLIARLGRKALPRLAKRRFKWSVAAKLGDWRTSSSTEPAVLRNPAGCFSADPFVLTRNSERFCFLEEYSYANRKATIACYRIADGMFERVGVAVEEPFHLSFPFVFEAGGEWFMCPESSTNRDIRLYRCTRFPLEWRLESVAVANISAVDTVIFSRSDRWWMITCVNPLGTGDQFSELTIFSTDSLLAGKWTPHRFNPIRIDEVTARNGGFFSEGGKHFRVNQVQGFGVYGESIVVNEVTGIDDDMFEELPLVTPSPISGDGVIGVHHLSRDGDLSVFDFSANLR